MWSARAQLAHFLAEAKLPRTARAEAALRQVRAKVPVLVMHGDADSVIPFACGRDLFDALEGPKEMWVVPGSDHNEVPIVGGEAYFGRVVGFVGTVPTRR